MYCRIHKILVGGGGELFIRTPKSYDKPSIINIAKYKFAITPLKARAAKAATTDDSTAMYYDAYTNTDVEQIITKNKLKENVILKEPGHPMEFQYDLGNIKKYIVEKDGDNNINIYDRKKLEALDKSASDYGNKKLLYKVFTMPAAFLTDSNGVESYNDVITKLDGNILTLRLKKDWLDNHLYPIILDPTVIINVLTLHSIANPGANWEVDFTTQGTETLSITLITDEKYTTNWGEWPIDDETTLNHLRFIELYGDGEPVASEKILDANGNIIEIRVENWSYAEGRLVNRWLLSATHSIEFNFGGEIAYAYNGTDQIPVMTSATAPSGTASAGTTYSTEYPWQAMDSSPTSTKYLSLVDINGTWLAYEFTSNKTISSYSVTACQYSAALCQSRAPKNWTLDGWNGSSWITEDTVTNSTGWALSEKRTFTIDNPSSYIKYRIDTTAMNGADRVEIGNFELIIDTVADGAVCTVDGDCTNSNCVKEIDTASSFCAATGKECSENSASHAGYDTGDVGTNSNSDYVCKGDDLGGYQCTAGNQCDEYGGKYCNGVSTWTSGSSNGVDAACSACVVCGGTASTNEGNLSCNSNISSGTTDAGECIDSTGCEASGAGACACDGIGNCDTNNTFTCTADAQCISSDCNTQPDDTWVCTELTLACGLQNGTGVHVGAFTVYSSTTYQCTQESVYSGTDGWAISTQDVVNTSIQTGGGGMQIQRVSF